MERDIWLIVHVVLPVVLAAFGAAIGAALVALTLVARNAAVIAQAAGAGRQCVW